MLEPTVISTLTCLKSGVLLRHRPDVDGLHHGGRCRHLHQRLGLGLGLGLGSVLGLGLELGG